MAVRISVRCRVMDFVTHCVFFLLYMTALGQAQKSNHFKEKDLMIHTFLNPSIRNYSYLYIDNATGSLFVGARNRLVQLSLININASDSVKILEVPASESNRKPCFFNGKSNEYCQNYIKYVVRVDNLTLSFCGTDANTPSQYTAAYNVTTGSYEFTSKSSKATACPRDPKDNTTAVYVRTGNPGDLPALYAATINDNGKATISRPELITSDSTKLSDKLENADPLHWLNEPQFVASFEVDDVVYFFFREIAVEFTGFMKKIVSRVAQVCKKDLGGSSLLVNKWTTYQKARLNCSLPGTFPFYFDEIQDVQLVNDTFYALFISSANGSSGSAICAFTVQSVKDRFADRVYKYRETLTSVYSPLPAEKIPADSSPGKCIENSKTLKDVEENFMMEYPLKDAPVQQKGGAPLVFLDDIQMHVLQIDKERSQQGGSLILYAGSNTGDVYKIHSWDSGKKQAIATVFSPLTSYEGIRDMKFLNDTLYISTDSSVKQFGVVVCDKYNKVDACLYDPYCTWKGSIFAGVCQVRKPGMNLYTHESIPKLMEDYFKKAGEDITDRSVGRGLSTTLPHYYPFTLDGKKVTWRHNKTNEEVKLDTNNMKTCNQDLVLSRATEKDEGTYVAYLGDRKLNTVKVTLLISNEDMENAWKARFTEWCEVFDQVKKYSASCNQGSC
ncbi:semaphorin-2A-like isoform X1 [Crassostrea angulata]|uniref:semaphorin-2A-like isoform X1 n=1 Tax=Magallana angulata TaxID=2784310 RepID=UPI0022B14BC9|nr:semaphorin-2A-like isoform X1 [Crassostrea angulata]XP_052697240.1 semaphorin-2A-like isoform X1 [Crassostrea angulata]XP_052697241.1 semaphorin-2A-like isoform X1 [Crassostrea angulata]XP_052697242.1 semaphorin-2A-like isoform X1 [Crassostrea angulata]XP_052697243.1 semaphorin-2A-like isoform X1 [Crassostrea angulata]XP_052697244.1 semaphorin-2A-like isoform X1 [Crassostrea angulata]XP_052697245.1 semaphorin-2A-like isoform X1 [Crassostrea angulata]XP_052697246.1 semaphorin-2A-like isofo